MWNNGDRVLVNRSPDGFWYPGTVRHIDGNRCYVICDDGDDALVFDDQLKPLHFEVADMVQVRSRRDHTYTPGQIIDRTDDQVCVRYSADRQEWTSLDRIRVRPEEPGPAGKEQPPDLAEGARVLACCPDLYWYPGVILSREGERIHVLFDDGSQGLATPDQVRELELGEGEAVSCRFKGGPEFFPGTITWRRGEWVHIQYDDGDDEETSLRLVRLQRDEWFPDAEPGYVAEGDRVAARWLDGYWYPGVVLAIEGKRLHILFDDGDQLLVTPSQVKPLQLGVGDRVFCRWKGGPMYFPGEITRKDGERIHVHYDDGDEETTTIRLVRVES
jgi:hypothetical protein